MEGRSMSPWVSRALGVGLALLFLVLGLLPGPGGFLICVPFFFIAPLAYASPAAASYFVGVFGSGWIAGRFLFHHYGPGWALPQVLALAGLALAPILLRQRTEAQRTAHRRQLEMKETEFRGLQTTAERTRSENSQIEKQLRQIEHLYDVIKEAGTTLNVQEMIELAKDFTERMFDLPHFLIAVLSNDGRKFEVRIASGCDDSLFRSFGIDLDANSLGAHFARQKKPLWIPDVTVQEPYSRLQNLAVRSFVFLPFIIQDRVIGFLCAFSSQDPLIDQEKFHNFQVFCNQISIGLQKALLYEKVQKLSITDGLTKLFSHRYFKQRLEEELVLASRYSSQLSLLILDIDHFKHYNDNYGHVAGDHVLMETARILKEQSDKTHLSARYGGEEMVLVAPETTKEQGMELAERIRKAIESFSFTVGKETTQVTVSIGIATFPQDAQASQDLISRADKALYAAKSRGRNRIVAYPI